MRYMARKTQVHRLAALLLVVVLLTSCGKQASEATPTREPAGDPFAGLDLFIPNPYDPPIEMTSVTSVNATVKFMEGDDIHNNIWTRAYEQLLGIKLTYKWVVDSSMYDQKLGLSINSG